MGVFYGRNEQESNVKIRCRHFQIGPVDNSSDGLDFLKILHINIVFQCVLKNLQGCLYLYLLI